MSTRTGAAGQNVTIAVLDTGVDPGAPGLRVTPDGQRKIVDLVDCTSSGDVNTTTCVALSEKSTLRGISGRTLHVPQSVANLNKSGLYRLGVKSAYDFFPDSLVRRIKDERNTAWTRVHENITSKARLLIHQLRSQSASSAIIEEAEARLSVLQRFSKSVRAAGPFFDCVVFHDGTNWRAIVDTSQCGLLGECDVLEDFAIRGSYSTFSHGIMLNFGVKIYNDGDILSIIVDCSSHGTHVAGILAANFPEAPHLNGLAPAARIVSLKIGDARLSGMETHQGLMRALAYCLAHSPRKANPSKRSPTMPSEPASRPAEGTEYRSHDPDSISTEKPTSSEPQDDDELHDRSENTSEGNKNRTQGGKPNIIIDMVNMSYGEHTRDGNNGRFIRVVNELVYKHNVIFVSSAGNEGPALSSVSAPGGTTTSIIGVGAYVTPDMATQAYSHLQSEFTSTLPDAPSTPSTSLDSRISARLSSAGSQTPVIGMPYTWTSRGPVPNGGMTISICAPGGAIAPIPLWNLKKKQLMNGTSMSSPSAAGAVAVILSFLKRKGIPYTSALVRRAIENSARPLRPIHESGMRSELVDDENDVLSSTEASDLVFASGFGSIDALAACNYIENYMAPRKSPQASTDALPVGTTARVRVDINESGSDLVSRNNVKYASTHDSSGDSTFFLEDWHFKISVRSDSQIKKAVSSSVGVVGGTNGVYLRGGADTECVQRIQVTAELTGYDKECDRTKKSLSEIEVHLALETTALWVEVPKSLVFLGSERSFHVAVDPTELTAGQSHFAEVLAFVRHPGNGSVRSGPVFRVPITVLKPEPLQSGLTIRPWENVPFAPGVVVRRFYEAPCGATYAFIRITAGKSYSNVVRASASLVKKSGVHAEKVSEMANGMNACPIKEAFSETSISDVSTTETIQIRAKEGSRGSEKTVLQDREQESRPDETSRFSRHGHVRTFDLRVAQLLPQKRYSETETRLGVLLYPGAVYSTIAQLEGQSLFELCLAQVWSSAGSCCVKKVELIFGGIVPRPSYLHAHPGMLCFPRLEIVSYLPSGVAAKRSAMAVSGFSLKAVLTNLQKTVAPKSTRFHELSNIDFVAGSGPTYQMEISYTFEMYESGKVKLRFPSLNSTVYESEIEGGPYVMIHHQGKRFVMASDIYPKGVSLPKDEYTATVYVRHESMGVLEDLSEMLMTVEYNLPSEMTLEAFDSAHAACLRIGSRKLSRNKIQLEKGERIAVFLATPKRSALPKWATSGDTLTGNLTVDKLVTESSNDGSNLPVYRLAYSIGTAPSSKQDSSSSPSDSAPPASPVLQRQTSLSSGDQKATLKVDNATSGDTGEARSSAEAGTENSASQEWECESTRWVDMTLRKARMTQLKTFLNEQKTDRFKYLYDIVKIKHGEDTDVLMLALVWADREACKMFSSENAIDEIRKHVHKVTELSDRIRGKLDPIAIAGHFAFKLDTSESGAIASRKSFEKKRQDYIEALFRKARGLSLVVAYDGFKPDGGAENDIEEEFEKTMKELGKWVSLDGKGHMPGMATSGISSTTISDEDLAIVSARREAMRGRYGCALQVLGQYYNPTATTKKAEASIAISLQIDILKALKWDHLVERELEYRLVRFPQHRTEF